MVLGAQPAQELAHVGTCHILQVRLLRGHYPRRQGHWHRQNCPAHTCGARARLRPLQQTHLWHRWRPSQVQGPQPGLNWGHGKGDEEEPESPPSNADEAEEVSDDGDEEEDDEEEEEDEEEGGGDDPELQPILAKKSATPGSSPEKKAEPWKRTAATVESPPKPVADSASASEEGDVRAPMANLFGFLPRPAFQQQSAAASAPTPDHHRLTSEGLPQGWTMQLMRNGRTLFIDNTNQVRKNIVQKPFVCAPLLILCLPR
jgi:hypothetical protein